MENQNAIIFKAEELNLDDYPVDNPVIGRLYEKFLMEAVAFANKPLEIFYT